MRKTWNPRYAIVVWIATFTIWALQFIHSLLRYGSVSKLTNYLPVLFSITQTHLLPPVNHRSLALSVILFLLVSHSGIKRECFLKFARCVAADGHFGVLCCTAPTRLAGLVLPIFFTLSKQGIFCILLCSLLIVNLNSKEHNQIVFCLRFFNCGKSSNLITAVTLHSSKFLFSVVGL